MYKIVFGGDAKEVRLSYIAIYKYCGSIIPSPTKLRRDIVTLPSVLPSFSPSVL